MDPAERDRAGSFTMSSASYTSGWNLNGVIQAEFDREFSSRRVPEEMRGQMLNNLIRGVRSEASPLNQLMRKIADEVSREIIDFATADGDGGTEHSEGVSSVQISEAQADSFVRTVMSPSSISFELTIGSPYRWIHYGNQTFFSTLYAKGTRAIAFTPKVDTTQDRGAGGIKDDGRVFVRLTLENVLRMDSKAKPPRPFGESILRGVLDDYNPQSGKLSEETMGAVRETVRASFG